MSPPELITKFKHDALMTGFRVKKLFLSKEEFAVFASDLTIIALIEVLGRVSKAINTKRHIRFDGIDVVNKDYK